MNIGQMFFGQLTFSENLAVYNGLTFKRNEKGTHFDATSIIRQCSTILGVLDRNGLPGKTWAVFARGKNGQIPADSHYKEKVDRSIVRWVSYTELLPILTYALGDGNITNNYLMDEV